MRIALMIEGQEDVTWKDWVVLAEPTASLATVELIGRELVPDVA